MRVIFLDIDGVLNSVAYAHKRAAKHLQLGHADPAWRARGLACQCFTHHKQIDRDAVARINQIADATAAKIVISSTWRKLFDLPTLARILGAHGLTAEIIGTTPDGYRTLELCAVYERIHRGHEIDFWLRAHPEVDRFVILDDDSDMAMHAARLVQTDCAAGLLDAHVEPAIRILMWQVSPGSREADGYGPLHAKMSEEPDA